MHVFGIENPTVYQLTKTRIHVDRQNIPAQIYRGLSSTLIYRTNLPWIGSDKLDRWLFVIPPARLAGYIELCWSPQRWYIGVGVGITCSKDFVCWKGMTLYGWNTWKLWGSNNFFRSRFLLLLLLLLVLLLLLLLLLLFWWWWWSSFEKRSHHD